MKKRCDETQGTRIGVSLLSLLMIDFGALGTFGIFGTV